MGDRSIDITSLRKETGYITYDPGFVNTGSCMSSICYVNGNRGFSLRATTSRTWSNSATSSRSPTCSSRRAPNLEERHLYAEMLNRHSLLHVDMRNFFRDFRRMRTRCRSSARWWRASPPSTPRSPMSIPRRTSTSPSAASCPRRTIAAFSYRQMNGLDFVDPSYKFSYCENFLNMMFHTSVNAYVPDPLHVKALNTLLILHADHEQNCSTSAVRLVASSDANLYASVAAGCCALWGSKHGGANQEVMQMLLEIHAQGLTIRGHRQGQGQGRPLPPPRVRPPGRKTYDPRAKIAKRLCRQILDSETHTDPLLKIAMELEEVALSDPYFIERNLYPNVDFYTGIIFHAMGIPESMFTVLFAMGRLPGWIAHWLEWRHDPYQKIGRPRQVYSGPHVRKVSPLEDR